MEAHLFEGQRPIVTKHHLRLQTPLQGNKLLERLGSNECFDISDMCELEMETEPEDNSTFTPESGMKNTRPSSGDSIYSFISNMKFSRPGSGISESEMSFAGETLENLFWESEWLLDEQNKSSARIIKSSENSAGRPATAISIMRLPNGSKPMIIIPSTRPATAVKWIEGFRNHIKSSGTQQENSSVTIERESSLDYFQTQDSRGSEPRSCSRLSKVNRVRTSSIKAKNTPLKPKTGPKTSKSKDQLLQFSSKSNSSLNKTPRKSLSRSKNIKTPGKPIAVTKRLCCAQCSKKLGPAQSFVCKCKLMFCGTHRYSDRHQCTFDYKTPGKEMLEKNNPLIKKDKCIKL